MSLNDLQPDGRSATPVAANDYSLAERKAAQRLTQEQDTFEQKKLQDARWFILRMAMGILAMLVIPTTVVICILIIYDPHQDATVKQLAASALLVDILGLMGSVWRVILNPASVSQLAPVTAADEAPVSVTSSENSAEEIVSKNSQGSAEPIDERL